MKGIICSIMVLGWLMVLGCQPSKPEDVAKKFMSRQITAHEGFDLDTSKLQYEVIEAGDDSAKVAVTGDIAVQGEILLVKTAGQWAVAEKTPQSEPAAEPSAHK